MNLKSYKILPDQIRIDRRILARLLGYSGGNLPEPYPELIEHELGFLSDCDDISGGYRTMEGVAIDLKNGILNTGDGVFKVGHTIAGFLKGSESLAFFFCTAGRKISERSDQLMKEGQVLEGYICDVLGSLAVEAAMDVMAGELREEAEQSGLRMTNRYSPGYCGWQVSEQHKLFELFPPGFSPVTLTPSALMVPVKSVSGVIGLGKTVKYRKYLCDACNSQNCIYRNIKYI